MRRAFLTLMEMLETRGYDISHKNREVEIFSNPERFYRHVSETPELSINGVAKHKTSWKRIAFVFLETEEKANVPKSTIIAAKVQYKILAPNKAPSDASGGKQQVHGLILVTKKPMQDTTFRETILGRERIEVFLLADLYFNKTKHVLVPDHTLLTETEKKVVLGIMRLKETQLPLASPYDPIIMFLGAVPGDLVLVMHYEHKNNGVGRSTPYIRIVSPFGTLRHPATQKKIVFVEESDKTKGFGGDFQGLTPLLRLVE